MNKNLPQKCGLFRACNVSILLAFTILIYTASVIRITVTSKPLVSKLIHNMTTGDTEDTVLTPSVGLGLGTERDPCRIGCVGNPNARVVRIVHISDTHETHENISIPSGDILIHSGDFAQYRFINNTSFLSLVSEIDQFFAKQPHKHKVYVAGNHEICLNGQPAERIRARMPNVIYLQDHAVTLEGLKVYGSPWTGKRKSPASAFTCPYPELGKYWVMIPTDTDILVTHSPPHRIMDNHGGMGCPLLKELVLKQIRPMLHLFGHAHEKAQVMEKQGVVFSNGALFGEHGSQPIVIDVYLGPEVPNKTKIYRTPVWKEDGSGDKPYCIIV